MLVINIIGSVRTTMNPAGIHEGDAVLCQNVVVVVVV